MSSNNIPSKFKKMVQNSSAKELIITALAELLGTATLLFLGCLGCLGGLSSKPSHLQITLNFGLAVLVVIQCFGHISHAHVNPAMTVGAVVLGKKTIREALVYLTAQTFGAILGFGLLKVITPVEHLRLSMDDPTDMFCVTDLHVKVSAIQGLLIEGIATAILMLVACAVWDPRNSHNTDSVAIKFGLAVTCLATSVGPYTGCSMNPVRSLGPAIWNNKWQHHWVYWFGPLGGALLASLAYKTVFYPKDSDEEETTIPENMALNSIDSQKPEHI